MLIRLAKGRRSSMPWNNLGVLLTEMPRLEEACECFRRGLVADTRYNLADTLTDMDHDGEAAGHWKACWQTDFQSERAGYARRCVG